MAIVKEVLFLFLIDTLFVGLLLLGLAPLLVFNRAAAAVLKRNFVGYFSNPTGYVFLCLFVLLTSLAAFWPHEFFNANLANLDQLSQYLPMIMLIFIPAVTMGIWADERRQGTDELLLTLPADDADIVLGKYLAAASIFTVSLLFSQLSNYFVLVSLTAGDLDTFLIFATYFGYWLTGLAMLAIGMVASFLTANLTVGFILGVAFNAPLVYAKYADAIIPWPSVARVVSGWSISARIDDFNRGVISLSSFVYFAMTIGVGLYLSMLLIGKRHWWGGRDGHSLFWHYMTRAASLIVVALAATALFASRDLIRADVTEGQFSSLSRQTKQLLRELDTEHTIYIDAFIGEQIPEAYVKTRYELISKLRQFEAIGGSKVVVRVHDGLETFSETARLAKERFGIVPQTIRSRNRGQYRDEQVLFGAAFTSGLDKVVVPFFDYGIPVEYELIRSIATVAKTKRLKLGIVRTDAQLFGGFTFAGGQPQSLPRFEFITELEKQYDVKEIEPTEPIEFGDYDAILVAQPSSLGPQELRNVVDAVRAGVPTAIFEDPFPWFMRNVPATGEEKQPPGGMMFGGGAPAPKGDIAELWRTIGVDVPTDRGASFNPTLRAPKLVWQEFIPYRKLEVAGLPDTWIFARNTAPGGEKSINPEHEVTMGLDEVLFPAPGLLKPAANSDLTFTPLITTGEIAGTVGYQAYRENQQDPVKLKQIEGEPEGKPLILAAQITGVPASEDDPSSGGDEETAADKKEAGDEPGDDDAGGTGGSAKDEPRPINVVYVADIDLMIDAFLRIRARPGDDEEIQWQFENVTFLLNLIDHLSGDDKYIPVRRRKARHSTLRAVEEAVTNAREEESELAAQFQKEFDDALKAAQDENEKAVATFKKRQEDIQKKLREGGSVARGELEAAVQDVLTNSATLNRRLEIKREKLESDRDDNILRVRQEADLSIQKKQNAIKVAAVFIPPLPPLFVGIIVFVVRRLREREGIAKSRMR